MAAIRPDLLLVQQMLLPFISATACTIVLEYSTERTRKTEFVTRMALDALLDVNFRCKEPVPMMKTFKSLKTLFKPSESPLPFTFAGTTYKIREISIEHPRRNTTEAAIRVPKTNANFMLAYDKDTKGCHIHTRFRGDLPVWIKIGNPECWLSPEKGIPTGKVITKLLVDELGMTKANVKTLFSCSTNPQTIVDVVHALLVLDKTKEEAFALAHTSQLNAEIGQILEASHIELTSVKKSCADTNPSLRELLEETHLPKKQQLAFENQSKLREIQELTGIDLLEEDVPSQLDLTYQVVT